MVARLCQPGRNPILAVTALVITGALCIYTLDRKHAFDWITERRRVYRYCADPNSSGECPQPADRNLTLLLEGNVYRRIPHHGTHPVVDCYSSLSGDDRFCLPSWVIVAGAKSGSSSLWQYLCDNVASRCSLKEMHYNGEPIVPFIKKKMGQNPSFGSGNMGFLPPLQDFMERVSDTKFIILLRNPIDWAYAAWHFWCSKLFDGEECFPGAWASKVKGSVARTPKNFEKLLKKYCSAEKCFAKGWSVWDQAEKILDRVPGHRVIVVRSEDLAENMGDTLGLLWDFLELPHDLRHPDIVTKAFNTGKKNGVENSQTLEMSLGNSYEPMTQTSSDLLCNSTDYWSRLSYFVNKYQIKVHERDFQVCK